MNLVFIGASKFGLRCLELSCSLPGFRVAGVVTAPRTFSISYRPSGVTNVLHADVETAAKLKGTPVAVLDSTMNSPALIETVRAWEPDAFLVVGWYHMIPRPWRLMAPAFGLHASLLPDYSGGAPLVWAMINGESKTGITLFQMDEGVDSGPIAAQAEEPIRADDTIATLYARIEERGLGLLRQTLPALAQGTVVLVPQDERRRRIMPQRSPEDGRIDWTTDATAIDRFVRAQTRPYPGAFSTLNGDQLTIWAARAVHGTSAGPPGRVCRENSGYSVVCGTGRLVLEEVVYHQRDCRGDDLTGLFGVGGQHLG